MKYIVTEEVSYNEGEIVTWYIVEPENIILRYLHRAFPINYSPHLSKEEAFREAGLKSSNMWDRVISSKSITGVLKNPKIKGKE